MRVFLEDAFLVHLLDQRADFLVGKLADVVAEKNLVFGESGQGRGNGAVCRVCRAYGHLQTEDGKPEF